MIKALIFTVVSFAVSVGLLTAPAVSDTQWGGKTHHGHHVARDTQWGG